MLEELRKRPFMRPLLIWVAGIILQSYFSCMKYALWLLLPVLLICCPPIRHRRTSASYEARWNWGILFALLLLFLSICRTASVEQTPPSASLSPHWVDKAERVRHELLATFEPLRLTQAEKSVLSTVTLGYRRDMTWQTRQKFSISGVAHILSVSGFHVAVVCGCLSFLFYFLPRYRWAERVRFVALLLLLWSFVFLTGLSAPAVRAGLMITMYAVGRVLERRTERYNIWAASAFLMLVYNPHYLFDIGFELSYIAVFFLFWLQPDIKGWLQVRNPLLAAPWDWITITLAAQTGVGLLCMYYFGEFSSVFLLAALPVTMLSTLLIPAALLWMLLPAGWGGAIGLDRIVETLMHMLYGIVDLLSGFPWASIPFRMNPAELFAAYGALILLILAFKKRYSKYLIISLACLVSVIIF